MRERPRRAGRPCRVGPTLVAVAWAALATGCSPDAGEPPATDARDGAAPGAEAPAPAPLTEAEEARAREVGSRAARTLQSTLAPRLMEAMQEGGPAHAVRFCATAADSLTGAAAEAAGLEVRRTSLRVRNPANAPDRWEAEILRRYDALAAAGDSLPPGTVQAVSDEEMRFYAPLTVAPLCVRCHGPPDSLAAGVPEILDAEYPDDRATGYEVGDLRGLVRVSIPRGEIGGETGGETASEEGAGSG